ncbi:MAG: tetratricopeptide repeat protein [Verrucomicrobiae bacterium]|nr:tetratricopeptide repeat protein [Verrucomicrobiae bacterium]
MTSFFLTVWLSLGVAMFFHPAVSAAQETQKEEGVGVFEKAAQANPKDAGAWRDFGIALAKAGRMDEALPALRKAVDLQPSDAGLWFKLGTVQERMGRFQEAVESYEKAVAADPGHADACFNLAILKLQFGKGGEAAKNGRAYLNLKGWQDAGALYMVLVCHFGFRQAGEDEAAGEIIGEAVQKGDAAAWPFPVVRCLKGDLDGQELIKTAEGRDKQTEARTYLGLAAMMDGQKKAAGDYFRWVQKEGDRALFEYRFATARLKELDNEVSSPWDYRKLKSR